MRNRLIYFSVILLLFCFQIWCQSFDHLYGNSRAVSYAADQKEESPFPQASLSPSPEASLSPSPEASLSPAPEASLSPATGASPTPSPVAPGTSSPSTVQEIPEVSEFEELLGKMKSVNSGLKDYSADLKMKMKAKYSVLEIPLVLDGSYYFKNPDKHKIKVNKAPNFLAQYPQVFGWSLPNPEEFTGTVKCEEGNCKVLKLIPIMGMGDLLKIEIWVDKSTFLYSRQVCYYRDGGKIALDITYKEIEGFHLFDHLKGSFEFPRNKLHASGEARYEGYKINSGLPDTLFSEEKK